MMSQQGALTLDRRRSVLLIVDVQERLVPAMHDVAPVIANCEILMRAAARLGVPVVVSEQYPKGLGKTIDALTSLTPANSTFAKTHFALTGDATIAAHLEGLQRDQYVICGMEAHVCVLQTALGLRHRKAGVFVVADAVTSRRSDSVDLGVARMRGEGCAAVNTEMVVFEWLERAGTPEFKDLSALIR